MRLTIKDEGNSLWYVNPDGKRALYPESLVPLVPSVPQGGSQLRFLNNYVRNHRIIWVEFSLLELRMQHADGRVERFDNFESFVHGAFHADLLAESEEHGSVMTITKSDMPSYSFSKPAPPKKNQVVNKPAKLDWRLIDDPYLIKQWFPDQPSADDILDLHAKNKQLQNAELKELIEQASKKMTLSAKNQ